MAEAEVGDDCYGEDPTVNRLQDQVASLLGKEAAIFVPSGTMANLIAVRAHTEPGDEMIADTDSHLSMFESGGVGAVCGVRTRPVPTETGILTPEAIEAAIRPWDHHFPRSRLVVVENTHNIAGGRYYTLQELGLVSRLCLQRGLALHMDGARLWNACVASGTKAKNYARFCDTVTVCLSKGLGAPVGSVLCGTGELIRKARRLRKMLGGTMRQAGILAGAALYALQHHLPDLVEDHEKARILSTGLSRIDGLEIDPANFPTNIVLFEVSKEGLNAPGLVAALEKRGVLVLAVSPRRIRAVLHRDLSREDIAVALEAVLEAVSGG